MKFSKEYCSLLILLIGLSGCVNKKKTSAKPKSKKNNKVAALNIPVAQDTIALADDETIRNFFDQDIDEFVALAQGDATNSNKGKATDQHRNPSQQGSSYHGIPNDTQDFAWMNAANTDQEFQTIYFDFDDHAIRKDQEVIANNDIANAQAVLAEARKHDSEPVIVIEGHACHSAGSSIYNLALSERRAKTIADWFKAQHVPEENIKIVGRGSEMPAIVDGKPVEGDKKQQWPNRRAEIHVVYS